MAVVASHNGRVVGFASDVEAGMALDPVHAGIAKAQKAATLVDLDDRHTAIEVPAQHGVGAIVRGRDPGRAGLLQLGCARATTCS